MRSRHSTPLVSSLVLLLLAVACLLPDHLAAQSLSSDEWLQRVALIMAKADVETYKALNPKGREEFRQEFWKKHPYPTRLTEPEESERVYLKRADYTAQRFGEAGKPGWTTQRGFMFLIVNPPARIVRGKVAWDEDILHVPHLQDLLAYLQAKQGKQVTTAQQGSGSTDITSLFEQPATVVVPGAEKKKLTGSRDTEWWVYPVEGGSIQVYTFVDADGDGVFRLAKDEITTPTALEGKGTSEEFGKEWYPEPKAVEPPPRPEGEMLPIGWLTQYFRSPATGATIVRIVADVSLDAIKGAGLDPAAWPGQARFLLGIRDSSNAWIEKIEHAESAATYCEAGICRSEFNVELNAGSYGMELVLLGQDKKGGVKDFSVTVPDYGKGLALSSVVIARPKLDAKGEPYLEPSGFGKEATPEQAASKPFVYGSYQMLPLRTDLAAFKPGDWVAIYVVAYNTERATVNVKIVEPGSGASADLEATQVDSTKPAIVQFAGTQDGWPEGTYEVTVSAKDARGTEVFRKGKFILKK